MSGSGPKHLRLIAAAALLPLTLVLIGAGPSSDLAVPRRGTWSLARLIRHGFWFRCRLWFQRLSQR